MLLEAGFDVVSVDVSGHMLRQAQRNAERHGVVLNAVQADWRSLRASVDGDFDALICLGSSFPHLERGPGQLAALRQFHETLAPAGVIIIDHRNFDSIASGTYRNSGRYYYCGGGIDITTEYLSEDCVRFTYRFPDRTEYSLRVTPLRVEEMAELLRDAGFRDTKTYGDFQTDFDRARANFIIHSAVKE
jgi:glycine/sarcosine N-methyltransferase